MFTESHGLKWSIEKDDFSYFKEMLYQKSGIWMKEVKSDLMSSRLRRRVTQLGMKSLHEYRQHLEKEAVDSNEWQIFINLLTTNKTDFFREPDHYEYLIHQFIPEWLKLGKKHLNIWSCASSTGEEPYTLAMIFDKHLPDGITFSILATDIDTNVLSTAKNGVYSKNRLWEIPEEYFSQLAFGTGEVAEWFTLKKRIREKVQFVQHNLISAEMPPLSNESKYDLVLCRNVLIYFDTEGIEKTAKKIYQSTTEKGVLLIGHSESLQGKKGLWKTSKPSYYFKID